MMYSGGCIIVDHATGFVHVEHLVNFTTTKTFQAKCHFEKSMADLSVIVQAYQSDNGVFAAYDFLDEIEKGLLKIKFSCVSAHHQNGTAEHGIQSVLTKAWTLLIHAAVHWAEMADTSLWPMAVDYSLDHHRMPCPSAGMLSTMDIFLKTQTSRTHFKDMHVCGCSCYVLDPALQDEHKLPK